jgi:hypothetical protein
VSALKRITLIVPPSNESESDVGEFYDYDQFAKQLRPHTSAVVEVVEDEFSTPPSEGIILLDRYGSVAYRLGANNSDEEVDLLSQLWPPEARHRIFCLNVDRGNSTLAMLERLGLAGAVDRIDYLVAVREIGLGTSYGNSGLYGLRTIADSLGCTIDYEKDRYCKTIVPPFASLAELLGRYLEAYWATTL